MAQKEITESGTGSPGMWLPAVLIGWLVPGGGHFFLKRPGRAGLIGGSVLLMFLLGLGMQGAMFVPQKGDLLTTLINYGGFVGNLCTGMLYFITTWMGYNQPDVAGHVHDYGTKFLVSAGLLNILGMVDAYEIAMGKKS